MKKLLSVATATILAAGFAMPLNAAPMFVPKPELAQANVVENVAYYHRYARRYARRSCRYYGNCGYYRPYYHGYYRPYYPGYYRPYYHGYYRPYYRPHYPGYYYPPSGLSLYFSF